MGHYEIDILCRYIIYMYYIIIIIINVLYQGRQINMYGCVCGIINSKIIVIKEVGKV